MISRFRSEAWIFLSFSGLILFGTFLLCLPATTHQGISLIDALFTATSAACVTGLIVVDTGSYFTGFGQVVILLLIQMGGLGIITLSSFFAILLGKRMPLKQREIVRETHLSLDPRAFLVVLWRIIWFTLGFEALGGLCLFLAWKDDFSAIEAMRQAAFHSVSAFCNAGFSLFPDNLVRDQGNLGVQTTVLTLVILGSIGFFVIYDVERMFRYRRPLSLHSKLAILTSFALILVGTLLFFVLEYHNVLAESGLPRKLLISLFQAITPRTAGFSTIDYGELTNSSLILTSLLMFVGGSPGSTAGGIKTTTFAVLLAMAYNRSQGRVATNLLQRTVSEEILNRALAIVLLSAVVLLFFNFGLQWSESGNVPHHQAPKSFMDTHFEVVSAFGTVGLSTGVTPHLSFWGKLQIILLMLIGRVGPLTVAVTIARRQQWGSRYEFYKENVMVG